jgi:hypothetical protein
MPTYRNLNIRLWKVLGYMVEQFESINQKPNTVFPT